ncbi:SRPBCC family protein [Fredinandcohnia humi]
MKQSILIHSPITKVFEAISTAEAREKWILHVTSITYPNQHQETQPGAPFQLIAVKENKNMIIRGLNKDILYPTLFSFDLYAENYVMRFSYRLHEQGEKTVVEQDFTTIYNNSFMNVIEKLFNSSTKETGDLLLQELKKFIEFQK